MAAPPSIRPISGSGDFATHAVGESHHQAALAGLAKHAECPRDGLPFRAQLVPDPDNRFDPDAVKVQIAGQQVGYLSRDDAALFHDMMHDDGCDGWAAEVVAIILGGFVHRDGTRASYGVRLDLDLYGG